MSRIASAKPSAPPTGAASANPGQAWLSAQATQKQLATTAKPKPLPANKPSPQATASKLDEAEKRLTDYSQQYKKKANGKAGLQKAMDWVRQGVNDGYGDDQFKNIGKSKQQLDTVKSERKSGKLSQSQAEARSATILQNFNREEARVTKAQANNAEVGKAVHGAGRVVVVTGVGIGATVATGGNVFVGFGAAAGAGSLYDAASEATKGKSSIAPTLETSNSLGGVVVRKLKGENVNHGDVARATLGTVTDGVSGTFAGKGVMSAQVARLSVQKSAEQAGVQASRWAMGNAVVKTSTLNTLGQTAATTGLQTAGTLADRTLTGEQKSQRIGDNVMQTIQQLPGQLAFGAVSNHLGVSTQIKNNKALDMAVQLGMDTTTNLAQASVNKAVRGEGFGLSNADVAGAMTQSAGGTIRNLAQRTPWANDGAAKNRDNAAKGLLTGKTHSGQLRRAMVVAAKDKRTANEPATQALTLAMKMRAFGNSAKSIVNDKLFDNYLNTIDKQPIGKLVAANQHVINQAGNTLEQGSANVRKLNATDVTRVPLKKPLPQMDSSNKTGTPHETHTVFGSVSKLGEVQASTNAFGQWGKGLPWSARAKLPDTGMNAGNHWQVDNARNWSDADKALSTLETGQANGLSAKQISTQVQLLAGDGFLPKGTPLATRMQRLEQSAAQWESAQSQLKKADPTQAGQLIKDMQSNNDKVQQGFGDVAASPKANRMAMLNESLGTPATTYALTMRHAAAARYMKSIEGNKDAVFDANKFRSILKDVQREAKKNGQTPANLHWNMVRTYNADKGFTDVINSSSQAMKDAWSQYKSDHGVH